MQLEQKYKKKRKANDLSVFEQRRLQDFMVLNYIIASRIALLLYIYYVFHP